MAKLMLFFEHPAPDVARFLDDDESFYVAINVER